MDDLGMRTSIPARVHNVTWETSSWTLVPTNILPSSSETDTGGGAGTGSSAGAPWAMPSRRAVVIRAPKDLAGRSACAMGDLLAHRGRSDEGGPEATGRPQNVSKGFPRSARLEAVAEADSYDARPDDLTRAVERGQLDVARDLERRRAVQQVEGVEVGR